jgi:hypothetical protein
MGEILESEGEPGALGMLLPGPFDERPTWLSCLVGVPQNPYFCHCL